MLDDVIKSAFRKVLGVPATEEGKPLGLHQFLNTKIEPPKSVEQTLQASAVEETNVEVGREHRT